MASIKANVKHTVSGARRMKRSGMLTGQWVGVQGSRTKWPTWGWICGKGDLRVCQHRWEQVAVILQAKRKKP